MARALLPLLLGSMSLCAASHVDDPSVISMEIQRVSNDSLLWGPYNPGLYFGMRPRIPKSVTVGLMWGNLDDFATAQGSFRHTCEQGDNMKGYGWVEYDARTGGKQVIHDQGNKLDIEIDLVKVPGARNGGNWGARVKGKLRPEAVKAVRTSVVFYATTEDPEGSISLENEPDPQGLVGPVRFKGHSPGLDGFHIELAEGPGTNSPPTEVDPRLLELEDEPATDRALYRVWSYPAEHLWRVKNIFFHALKERFEKIVAHFGTENIPPPWQALTLKPTYGEGNLHVVQKVYEGDFEFNILFSSDSAGRPITSDIVTEKIEEYHNHFGARFDEIFKRQPPFDDAKYEPFARELFSNLLGGIGFFHGTSLVDRSEYPEDDENFWEAAKANREKDLGQMEGPTTLFTSIPSRPFFPRGFLWDEGFHLLPIIEWDVDLTMHILTSWYNLIDDDGWIAREQILGDEARNKVPREFQTQYPHYANPPTLVLVLTKFIEKWHNHTEHVAPSLTDNLAPLLSLMSDYGGNSIHNAILNAADHYLKAIYPLLRRHYFWFRDSQAGEVRAYDRKAFSTKEAYRWRGRAPGYCLTSGIDDYPRAEPPHPGELHVDLISWMGFFARLMEHIAFVLGEHDDRNEYSGHARAIIKNIDDLHWNDEHKCYCDATVDSFEESVHVCHVGYVSIFPFLLGLLPHDSEKLSAILDIVGDPEQLWSPYGLRSLSRQDEFYSKGENYWRGPIWVNMNYLALLRLKEYGSVKGPYQKKAAQLYGELRKNVVENVYKNWVETGFAWEQYEQETGKAKGVQHFLGWTSLVVNIMSMPEAVDVIPMPSVKHDEL
ncbi:Processing alpha glucosidase I [Orbilia brochopaga]|uniref:Mannosyl-oligosaccharide glucosidase n=1 Tax=Orbilia brochopaga TaxID=3140254 RepID=A0AAV9UXX5_9PEZI